MLVPSDAWLTTLRVAGEWIAHESGERDVARVVLILRLALVLSPALKSTARLVMVHTVCLSTKRSFPPLPFLPTTPL